MLLNATKCQGYSFYYFWVIKAQPTGGVKLAPTHIRLKDTFCFAKQIFEQDGFLLMGSLDLDLLFSNTPLVETIDICTITIYSQQDVIKGINEEDFRIFNH